LRVAEHGEDEFEVRTGYVPPPGEVWNGGDYSGPVTQVTALVDLYGVK
jgi:hypothetical protein